VLNYYNNKNNQLSAIAKAIPAPFDMQQPCELLLPQDDCWHR